MLQSLRSCALSIATASILACGLRGVIAPASASASGEQSATVASIPVHYLTSGPSLTGVELTLPDGARQVKVRLASGGSWYSCYRVGKTARCETPGATVQALEQIEIADA